MMRAGILGCGLMGSALARRLLSIGHQVTVYNRGNREVPSEARICSIPQEVIDKSDLLFITLSDYAAIMDVFKQMSDIDQKTFFQMATVSPGENDALCEYITDNGAIFVAAPVLGSRGEAATGKLLGMIGPKSSLTPQIEAVLSDVFASWIVFDTVAQAALTKLSLNFMILSMTATFSTAIAMMTSHGIDAESFMTLLRKSALYAPTFDKKLTNMLGDKFDNPNFPTKHLVKDADLFSAELINSGFDDGLSEALQDILSSAMEGGYADLDYSSMYRVIKDANL